MTPILNFAFANNSQERLINLHQESDEIYQLLMPFAKKQRIILHREQYATMHNVSNFLVQNNNPMTLFHYGGHADSEHLILNGSSARATNIALQLAQQKSLKLVFLNGCSTLPQVEFLLTLGIPAVIATSVPVYDSNATKFAIHFYKAITTNHTIKEAFMKAASVIENDIGFQPEIHRGLGRKQKSGLPWGLYTLDENTLDEKLIPLALSNESERNIFENTKMNIDEGNVHIGNTYTNHKPKKSHKKENIVSKSEIKIKKGDFRLGDDFSN